MEQKHTPFHVRLRELREAHGFSYRGLQAALEGHGFKITHTALRKWEMAARTDRLPRREIVAALSRVFNVKPSFLLEEIFDSRKISDSRVQQWQDVDLLTEEQHEILLSMKSALLGIEKPKGKNGVEVNGDLQSS